MEPYRYCVSLRIIHPSIDPDEISRSLGLEPVGKWKAGDPKVSPKGTVSGGLRNESFWSYHPHGETKLSSETQYIERYLEDLTAALCKHEEFFKSISDSGGRTEYYIGIFSEHSIGGIFHSTLLGKISNLNIDLSFDIYAYPE